MTDRLYTRAEKLEVVEHLIESHRWARYDDGVPEHGTWLILKSIASDIRANMSGAPNRTLQALAFQVNVALKAKSRIGYLELDHMQAVTECVIAHWAILQRSLEKFGR